MIRTSPRISKWTKEIMRSGGEGGGNGGKNGSKGWVSRRVRNGRSCPGTSRTRRTKMVFEGLGLPWRRSGGRLRRRASRGGAATTKVFCLVARAVRAPSPQAFARRRRRRRMMIAPRVDRGDGVLVGLNRLYAIDARLQGFLVSYSALASHSRSNFYGSIQASTPPPKTSRHCQRATAGVS